MKIAACLSMLLALACGSPSGSEPRSQSSPGSGTSALECGDGGACCTPCDGGACAIDAGASAPCEATTACTADFCGDGGCVRAPLPDGTSCDDGDACNGLSACLNGECVPGKPLRCC